jgi:hypothetical protein
MLRPSQSDAVPQTANETAIAAAESEKDHMWIFRLALNRSYTFVIVSLLLFLEAQLSGQLLVASVVLSKALGGGWVGRNKP